MTFFSTKDHAKEFSLRQAVSQGLAPDGGLFMPKELVPFSNEFLAGLSRLSIQEIAFEVSRRFIGKELHDSEIRTVIEGALTFDAPLVHLSDRVASLELFHGPTLAFKDFGAQFMASLICHLRKDEERELTVLVATSGDTGSAVGHGFHNRPGVRVVILYPSGKVSRTQELQLTTIGDNVSALEVQGTFDDCQALVKRAFTDQALQAKLDLTSANSINVARLIPQSFYYFRGYAQLRQKESVVVSVPSGNFGNLTAGLFAYRLGLPIQRFVAATNANKVVPEYIESSHFSPRPSVATISNAMDVGSPNNFPRLMNLFGNSHREFTSLVSGFSATDDDTREEIEKVHSQSGYVVDPHGAIGHRALQSELRKRGEDASGFFLHTAHPAKFGETVAPLVGDSFKVPAALEKILQGEKRATVIPNSYEALADYLVS